MTIIYKDNELKKLDTLYQIYLINDNLYTTGYVVILFLCALMTATLSFVSSYPMNKTALVFFSLSTIINAILAFRLFGVMIRLKKIQIDDISNKTEEDLNNILRTLTMYKKKIECVKKSIIISLPIWVLGFIACLVK